MLRLSRTPSCASAMVSARCAELTTATTTEMMVAATIAPTSATGFSRGRAPSFTRRHSVSELKGPPPKLLLVLVAAQATGEYLLMDVPRPARRQARPGFVGLPLMVGKAAGYCLSMIFSENRNP